MSLPGFLIIGAMKAGTTTLYRDLSSSKQIFLPANKEPEDLIRDHVLTSKGLNRYCGLFPEDDSLLCGEASTAYSKVETHSGVPSRAKTVLGSELKLIYIMRDPVERLISQYKHMFTLGFWKVDINEAIDVYPHIVGYSCYGKQLEPWFEEFSKENFYLLQFEDYVSERVDSINSLLSFLGLDDLPTDVSMQGKFNQAQDRRLANPVLRLLIKTDLYRRVVKPIIPEKLKASIRRWSTSAAIRNVATQIDNSHMQQLNGIFADDKRLLSELLG